MIQIFRKRKEKRKQQEINEQAKNTAALAVATQEAMKQYKEPSREELEYQRKQEERSRLREILRRYASTSEIIRESFWSIILGAIPIILELILMGPVWTIATVAIYGAFFWWYTGSMIIREGIRVYEISIESHESIFRMHIVPLRLWNLINHNTNVPPASLKYRGHNVYLANKVNYDPYTGLIESIDYAWIHFNQLEYASNKKVLDNAVEYLENLITLNSKLKHLNKYYAKKYAIETTEERFDAVNAAYSSPEDSQGTIEDLEAKISELTRDNQYLLNREKFDEQFGGGKKNGRASHSSQA